MDTLNILIPATPRYQIHEKTIIPIINSMNENSKLNLKVFLNMDVPKVVTQDDHPKTISALNNILGSKNIFVNINKKNPSFSSAY